MKSVLDVLIIVVLSSIFAFSHSILASNKVKKGILNLGVSFIAFYRFLYNIIALFTICIFFYITPRPDLIIYDLPKPYDFIILIPKAICFIGIIAAFYSFDFLEFLGITQIVRWFKNEYNILDMDERTHLKVNGLNKISRHPIYLFVIGAFLFNPQMDLFYLTIFILAIVYFYIGSIYEEKKLEEKFGTEYLNYKKNTGRIFPGIKL